ncbi:uncharacterized protein LOC114200829 [Eumetopias jubatus]|uniref:uncharacterized protein LOC114200829 n=1 Tax=Eumetopias jubatus TaxID=34886 RepID=UPI00101632A8|nr:uncharacterized protein LOC114200829 [Eumetopias jubatus]
MAAAARFRKGPFSNSVDRGCSKQHAGQLAAGLTACSEQPREALGLLMSLQNHFRCASVPASLSKLPLPEPPLLVFSPERPVGSHAGWGRGRGLGRPTSRVEVTRNQGRAVRSQTWDVSSGFNTPRLCYFWAPHFFIKWGCRPSPQCPAHIGFIKCWPMSRSWESSRPRPGLLLTFRKWHFGQVVTSRATQRGGGGRRPWEPGREARTRVSLRSGRYTASRRDVGRARRPLVGHIGGGARLSRNLSHEVARGLGACQPHPCLQAPVNEQAGAPSPCWRLPKGLLHGGDAGAEAAGRALTPPWGALSP